MIKLRMHWPERIALPLICLQFSSGFLHSQEIDPFEDALTQAAAAEDSLETPAQLIFVEPEKFRALIEEIKPSLVNITHIGRDDETLGTGSGFVIDEKQGLIATNFHVLGEARPIEVELYGGTKAPVLEVYASDQHLDLAILRIDPQGLDLSALKLGDSAKVKQGEPILGFGSPQGLKFSVVSGLVSALRELDDRYQIEGEPIDFPMIQIAMPIEMGNSGGPIVDLSGKVQGIVTIKSVVTDNLGFAVPINHLKTLIEQPNPIAMSEWRTIGALNPQHWESVMGGSWIQQGGAITAKSPGDGFGGRALCLSQRELPGDSYELAVRVKLDDESGAAGISFASDGEDHHYGFYPSSGAIRLTRFEGPSVYTWTIIDQVETTAYRPGEWNRLRVRVEPDKITGWVNGEKVMEHSDGVLRGGKVGLCKFRDTEAEFREFRLGTNLGSQPVKPATLSDLGEKIDRFAVEELSDASAPAELVERLADHPELSSQLLEAKAREMEERAKTMRLLESRIHLATVVAELKALMGQKEVDLAAAALAIARIDNPHLDVDYYLGEFDRLAGAVAETFPEKANNDQKVAALTEFLFEKRGFHGSRTEYYHHANSYIDHVLEHREGLPITLSVIYMELARRAGIKGISGIPLPGKFVVGYQKAADAKMEFIDVFDRGAKITRREAERMAFKMMGSIPDDSHFEPASEQEILIRMLRNLIGLEMRDERPAEARNYIELVLALSPDESQERFQRALLRYQDADIKGARSDFDFLIENPPPGIDRRRLEIFREQLEGQ